MKSLSDLVNEMKEFESRFKSGTGFLIISDDPGFCYWRGQVILALEQMPGNKYAEKIISLLEGMNGYNEPAIFQDIRGRLKTLAESTNQQKETSLNVYNTNDATLSEEKNPKLFISYSHDDESHKKWVLKLATDLRQHMGVDVTFDQWDLRVGGDLSLFMEQGLSDAALVLCVCSEEYVKKADAGVRGTGFEKMIIVQSMLQNTNTDHIIPIIRNNPSKQKTPRFLGTKLYIDFSDDSQYISSLSELVRRIYNEDVSKKPPIGQSPFSDKYTMAIDLKNAIEKTQYHSPELSGTVSFDYSNNSGSYIIGTGEYEFETQWSTCGHNSIHAYRDKVKAIGYISGCSAFPNLEEIMSFDYSSRARVVYIGEVVVWQNKYGHFAATKITGVRSESQGVVGNISFEYKIYA